METKNQKVNKVLVVFFLVASVSGLCSALFYMIGTVNMAQILLVITVVLGFITTLLQQYLLHRRD